MQWSMCIQPTLYHVHDFVNLLMHMQACVCQCQCVCVCAGRHVKVIITIGYDVNNDIMI